MFLQEHDQGPGRPAMDDGVTDPRRFLQGGRQLGGAECPDVAAQKGAQPGLQAVACRARFRIDQGPRLAQQGIEQGEKKARLDAARQMLADHLPLATIVKYTGLTEEDIRALGDAGTK